MPSKNIDDIIASIDLSAIDDSFELPSYEEVTEYRMGKRLNLMLNLVGVILFATAFLAFVFNQVSPQGTVTYLLIGFYVASIAVATFLTFKMKQEFREEYTYTTIDFIQYKRRIAFKNLRYLIKSRYYIYPGMILGAIVFFYDRPYQGLVSIMFMIVTALLIFNFGFFFELAIMRQRKKINDLR